MAAVQPLRKSAPSDPAPSDSARRRREGLAEQKAETRRRILDSARAVFLRQGFMDANLNEVASLAGVGKGTLYRHFESKGELYVAMLSENGDLFASELGRAVEPDGSALDKIRRSAHFCLDFWMQNRAHYQIVWAAQNSELIGPLSPELTSHLRRLFEVPVRMVEALIREGIAAGDLRPVDPWNAANALALSVNAVVGTIVMKAPPVLEADPKAVYRQLVDVLVAGLAQPAADASDPT